MSRALCHSLDDWRGVEQSPVALTAKEEDGNVGSSVLNNTYEFPTLPAWNRPRCSRARELWLRNLIPMPLGSPLFDSGLMLFQTTLPSTSTALCRVGRLRWRTTMLPGGVVCVKANRCLQRLYSGRRRSVLSHYW